MEKSFKQWIAISFFNLLIVAFIGVILRYKIVFSLPFIDQKHLLHGHSHFAFSGWLTQILFTLLINQLSIYCDKNKFDAYNKILWLNLLTAYGMLISFPLQGYGLFSISFSTFSIVNTYWFTVLFWSDLQKLKIKLPSFLAYKAALIFNLISSIGAFLLAYLMATKNINQHNYLLSVYGFLHFQYNGWFFFAALGLLIANIENNGASLKNLSLIVQLLALACVPAYFLSALWLSLPIWVYFIVVASALIQCIAVYWLFTILYKSTFSNWLLILSGIALSIKISLQLFSTIPTLSNIAFGFRPIVIGYLHLMLLGVLTIFILGYLFKNNYVENNNKVLLGVKIFVVGIIMNQLVLMVQGIAGMNYWLIPYMNESLIVTACIMFSGLIMLNYGVFVKKRI